LGGVAASVSLAVMASRENIMFYFDPSQVVAGKAPLAKRFRIGGMVVKGSVDAQARRSAGALRANRLRTKFPWNTAACCRICSARARASLPTAP
jgi:hypothetical protein